MPRHNVKNAYHHFNPILDTNCFNQQYLENPSIIENEISRSLKLFAMTAVDQEQKVQSEPSISDIDAVMQDFACNGSISDGSPNDDPIAKQKFRELLLLEGLYNAPATERKRKHYYNSKIEKYHCVFCENNNEPEAVVKSHAVRDSLGRVLCPKLRTYICPICKASGDLAHTVKYCPQKPIITMADAMKLEAYRLTKNALFRQHMKMTVRNVRP